MRPSSAVDPVSATGVSERENPLYAATNLPSSVVPPGPQNPFLRDSGTPARPPVIEAVERGVKAMVTGPDPKSSSLSLVSDLTGRGILALLQDAVDPEGSLLISDQAPVRPYHAPHRRELLRAVRRYPHQPRASGHCLSAPGTAGTTVPRQITIVTVGVLATLVPSSLSEYGSWGYRLNWVSGSA